MLIDLQLVASSDNLKVSRNWRLEVVHHRGAGKKRPYSRTPGPLWKKGQAFFIFWRS